MSEKKFTFIDLFAGCGGLSEGFLKTNKFEGLAHVEWELPMVETLRNRLTKKWNHTKVEALKHVVHFDIQKTDELLNGSWNDETKKLYQKTNCDKVLNKGLKGIVGDKKVDVIIGGPPCQAYSIHGRATDSNSMKEDYRNFLFESFAKTVEYFQPEMFVFENVPGILSAKPGGTKITKRIFEEFQKIGYEISSPDKINNALFDTSEFQVPQNRKRVLIIGTKKESKLDFENFYTCIKDKRVINKKVTVRDAIGFLPIITPLKNKEKEGRKNISHKAPKNNIAQHIPRYNNKRDVEIFKEWVENKMNYVSHKEKVEYYFNKTGKETLYSKYRNLEWDKQSYTIVAHLQKDGLMFIHPDANQARSITIREAALLMTFPIDYEFIGSNGYCYKMIGNAVPVNFAEAIGHSIYEVMTNKEFL